MTESTDVCMSKCGEFCANGGVPTDGKPAPPQMPGMPEMPEFPDMDGDGMPDMPEFPDMDGDGKPDEYPEDGYPEVPDHGYPSKPACQCPCWHKPPTDDYKPPYDEDGYPYPGDGEPYDGDKPPMDGDDMMPPMDDYDGMKPPMDGDFPDMDGMGGTGMPGMDDMGDMDGQFKPPFRKRRQDGSPWPVEGCTKNTKCWATTIAKKFPGWEDSKAVNLMCDLGTGFCVCKPGFVNADQDPFNGCEASDMPEMPVMPGMPDDMGMPDGMPGDGYPGETPYKPQCECPCWMHHDDPMPPMDGGEAMPARKKREACGLPADQCPHDHDHPEDMPPMGEGVPPMDEECAQYCDLMCHWPEEDGDECAGWCDAICENDFMPPMPPHGDGHPYDGYPEDGLPYDGYPENGYPEDGYPEDGYPDDGYPEDGDMPGMPDMPDFSNPDDVSMEEMCDMMCFMKCSQATGMGPEGPMGPGDEKPPMGEHGDNMPEVVPVNSRKRREACGKPAHLCPQDHDHPEDMPPMDGDMPPIDGDMPPMEGDGMKPPVTGDGMAEAFDVCMGMCNHKCLSDDLLDGFNGDKPDMPDMPDMPDGENPGDVPEMPDMPDMPDMPEDGDDDMPDMPVFPDDGDDDMPDMPVFPEDGDDGMPEMPDIGVMPEMPSPCDFDFLSVCPKNSECIPAKGGQYTCKCNDGFTMNGRRCEAAVDVVDVNDSDACPTNFKQGLR